MKTITFVIHGKLRKRKVAQSLEGFFGLDYKVKLLFTEKADQSVELARNAVAQGTDYLIAVGGDGTLNEVMNGLMQNPEEVRKKVIFGMIPAGSGNDFAKTMGVENNLEELKKNIAQDNTVAIDLGLLKFKTEEGQDLQRYFINIADIGIGGLVAQILHESPRVFGSKVRYMVGIVKGFLKFKHQPIKFTYDGGEWEGKAMSLCMANGKWFGSGMGIAPQADPTDSKMQLVLLGEVKLIDYIKNLSTIQKCKNVQHPHVHYMDSATCIIEALGDPCPIDMDGEFVGYTPVVMQTKPAEIRFLTSKKF